MRGQSNPGILYKTKKTRFPRKKNQSEFRKIFHCNSQFSLSINPKLPLNGTADPGIAKNVILITVDKVLRTTKQ